MAGRIEDQVLDDWLRFRTLTTAGRSPEAIEVADEVIRATEDPARRCQALLSKLAALMNLEQTARLGPLLDEIQSYLDLIDNPRMLGESHVLRGVLAYWNGSIAQAMADAALGQRALLRTGEADLPVVDTWHDLSFLYSKMGLHVHALAAQDRAAEVCRASGLDMSYALFIEEQVSAALWHDQRGDTARCVWMLGDVVETSRPVLPQLTVTQRAPLRYAAARLALLGHGVDLAVTVEQTTDELTTDLIRLTGICETVHADPRRGLDELEALARSIDVFGAAEPLRLRSLALQRLGCHAKALDAEREAMRRVAAEEQQIRLHFADGVNANLDYDQLRQMAARYADQAATDPLTGLANRRTSAQFAADLARDGITAVVGVLDLDTFKIINDTYGHAVGDLVLKRAAGIIAATVRQGDLVARHGGDEFLLVLPTASMAIAGEIGERIRAAFEAEDWSRLAPETLVSFSVGWATFTGELELAFKAADDALYRFKRERQR